MLSFFSLDLFRYPSPMLARISGVLEDIDGSTALVATDAGLAYEVLLPAHLAITLTPSIGEPITLHTHQFLT